MKNKWHRGAVLVQHPAEAEPVPIVADASIARVDVGDGRMIPLLILDTSKRPDIEDMINAHRHMGGQGDVDVSWGRPNRFFDTGTVALLLTFTKPSRCLILLQLDIGQYGGVVDTTRASTFSRVDQVTSCAQHFTIPAFLRKCPLVNFSLNGTACFGRRCVNLPRRSTG